MADVKHADENRAVGELRALRERLEAWERTRGLELAEMRRQIDALEKSLLREETPVSASVEPPPLPEPLRVVPEPEPLPPRAEEPVVLRPAVAAGTARELSEDPPQRAARERMTAWRRANDGMPLSAAEDDAESDTERAVEGDPKAGAWELRLGRVWLVRAGMALLLTGLVLLGNYAYRNWIRELPNGARLAALVACALALCEIGRRLAARPALARYGEVVLAGGMAFFYYCVFASHHVERLRVLHDPVWAALWLVLAAAGIAAVSWLRRSPVTAMLGVVLAGYAVMLQPLGWLSCFSALLMAAAGAFFLTRPGWHGPGWVSMLASHGSFLGWQLLGAAGAGEKGLALWFLPWAWLLFAMPGLLTPAVAGMNARAAAWFAGINNTLFLISFSLVWLGERGADSYWQAALGIGAVWMLMAVWARRRRAICGETYATQGLGLLTLALCLKLEGYHLVLGLAAQSLSLAVAHARWKGRVEVVFSMLAATAAFLWVMHDLQVRLVPIPAIGMSALALFATAWVLWFAWRRGETREGEWPNFVRATAAALFTMGGAVAGVAFCWQLPNDWPLPAITLLAGGMLWLSLTLDRCRLWPEPWYGAATLSLLALTHAFTMPSLYWAYAVAAGAALLLALAWRHLAAPPSDQDADLPVIPPREFGDWAAVILLVLCVCKTLSAQPWDGHNSAMVWMTASLALAGVALATRSGKLALVALAPGFQAMGSAVLMGSGGVFFAWLLCAMALAYHGLLRLPLTRHLETGCCRAAVLLARVMTALFLLIAWEETTNRGCADALAISALLIGWACLRLRRMIPWESWFCLSIATMMVLMEVTGSSWIPGKHPSAGWGLGVIASLWFLALWGSRQRPPHRWIGAMVWLACGMLVLWASRWTVTNFDARPLAVVWTLCGFATVSAGFWCRSVFFRLAGFCMLAMALLKVFAVDVWDFTAFMRVVSFLVLGAALMVLGLLYHRFAPLMKDLFTRDSPAERASAARKEPEGGASMEK